jgi:hypothetical protein
MAASGSEFCQWADSVHLSIILLVVKYAGSIIAGAYGVYATVTDLKEDKDGKRVLSNKGRFGIALLLFSLLINMSADGLKDWKEKCDSKQQTELEAKRAEIQRNITTQLQTELKKTETINEQLTAQQNQLEKTVATTSSILKETRRASDLFSLNDVRWFIVGFSFSINDPFVKPYTKRVIKTKFPNSKEGELFTENYLITIHEGDDLWPQKNISSEAVLTKTVSTEF